jgi:pentatricopeptide repeat protein
MIDGYAKMEGGIRRARALFDAIPHRNEVSWAVMISGLVENELYEEAWELFVRMPLKNVVACTAMINGFCKQGKIDEAWNLFQQIPCRDCASWNIMITGSQMFKIFILLFIHSFNVDLWAY